MKITLTIPTGSAKESKALTADLIDYGIPFAYRETYPQFSFTVPEMDNEERIRALESLAVRHRASLNAEGYVSVLNGSRLPPIDAPDFTIFRATRVAMHGELVRGATRE